MKKITGVVLGVSFLSAMAYTAFAADLLNTTLNATSVISPTTSTVDTSTSDTSVSTTDTTSGGTTLQNTTATPTTSSSLSFKVGFEGGDSTITGTEHVFVQVSKTVYAVELFLRQEEALDTPHLLGTAKFDDANDRWVYEWDSVARTQDGTYILRVRAMASDGRVLNTSAGVKVIVINNEKVATVTSSATTEYIKTITEKSLKVETQATKQLTATVKESAVQNESTQVTPISTSGNGSFPIPQKPKPVDFEKVINENSQKLKDAIDQGDTKKESAVVAEIVRVAQGTSAQADTESTRRVEEAVAKLKQVLVDQTHGVVDETTFKVESVKVAEVTTKPDGTQTASKIEFRGKALPNSFVTVYIFSIPIVVTVKADSEGNWNYTLDKELDNGNHQVYVGLTDVKGKVVVKSNPLPFVKTASAITVEEALAVPQAEAAPSFVQNNNFYGIVTIIILVLISVFIFLGFKMSKNPNNSTE